MSLVDTTTNHLIVCFARLGSFDLEHFFHDHELDCWIVYIYDYVDIGVKVGAISYEGILNMVRGAEAIIYLMFAREVTA